MATYSFSQQPYSISSLGYSYANTRTIVDGQYARSSLFGFQETSGPGDGPIFFADVAKFTLNFVGGTWYINLRRADDSFVTFFTVQRLEFSDGDRLVFTDGNYDYVIDDGGIDYTESFQVRSDVGVEPGPYRLGVNVAPSDVQVVGPPLTVAEGADANTPVGTVEASDAADAGDTFTYSLSDDAGGAFQINSTTGVITVADGSVLDYEQATSRTIKVLVTDLGGLTLEREFTVTLTNVVDPPVLSNPVPDVSANEGVPFTFTVPADTFTSRDAFTYSATLADGSALPSWLKFNPATGKFSGTPDDADVGSINVRVTATHPDGTASDVFQITVGNDAIVTVLRALSLEASPEVEELSYAGDRSFVGVGNALANQITGGTGNDKLLGLEGDDLLIGNAGKDRLLGGVGNDRLLGGADSDRLGGGQGDDTLEGGLGQDAMRGGDGRDVFVYASADESKTGEDRHDEIRKFVSGEDTIDLSGIDTNARKSGDQDFDWVDARNLDAAFRGKAGELRFEDGLLQGDLDGDGRADFEIHIRSDFSKGDVLL